MLHSSCWGKTADSSKKMASMLNLGAFRFFAFGKPKLVLSLVLTLWMRASRVTLEMSATLMVVGSIFPPAPPQVTTGISRLVHSAMRNAFCIIRSMASITKS